MVDAGVRELLILLYYICLVKRLHHFVLDEDSARVASVSKPEQSQHGSMLYEKLQCKAMGLSVESDLSCPFIKQNSQLIARLKPSEL